VAVNDPPEVILPEPQSTFEDEAKNIAGIGVTDPDSGSNPIVVTLAVPRGTLTVAEGVAGGAAVDDNGSGQVTLTGSVAQINATLNDLIGVLYQPMQDDNGTVLLTVTANDQGHTGADPADLSQPSPPLVVTRTLTVTIQAVNDPPELTLPGDQVVAEDAALTFSAALGNAVSVFDVEATPKNLNVRVQLNVQHGTLTVGTNVLGGVVAGNVGGNGTGSLILTGTPTQINTTLAAGLTYRGLANFNGTDVLNAELSDLGNIGRNPNNTAEPSPPLTDLASLTITVTAVNDPPIANPDSFAMSEDGALTVTVGQLTANDLPGPPAPPGTVDDESGQTIRFMSVASLSQWNGTVTYTPDQDDPSLGRIVYTPLPHFNGTDTFTYTIDDGDPDSTASGTVTVTVTAVNDPPVARNVAFTTNEDVTLSLTASQLIGNDSPGPVAPDGTLDDESAQTLMLVAVDPTSHHGGTVTFNPATGTITYAPRPNGNQLNFPGPDWFTYRVRDNGLTSGILDPKEAVATVTIAVAAVNDPPVITAPASATVDEDVPQAIAGIAITDIDAGEGATAGNLTVTFAVSQGTVTVNTTVVGGITGVLNNGTGLVTVSATPAQLAATLSHPSGLQYLSNLNFNGTDQLVINANDAGQTGTGPVGTASRTVTITVRAINDPPVLTLTTTTQNGTEDTPLTLAAMSVADVDAGTGKLQVRLSVQHGMLTVNTTVAGGVLASDVTNNGTREVVMLGTLSALNITLDAARAVTYVPDQDFFGQDTVTITVNDQGNTGLPGPLEDQRAMTLLIANVNDPPVANNDPSPGAPPYTIDKISVLTVAGRGVLDNDVDVDDPNTPGGQIQVHGTDAAGVYRPTSTRGVVVDVRADGTFTYDPRSNATLAALRPGQSVVDTFQYRAVDGEGAISNWATVTITVTGANTPPIAVDDQYTTTDNVLLDTTASMLAPSVLANDSDREGDPLQVVVAASDAVSTLGAKVEFLANGNFKYDPRVSSTLAALQEGDPPLTDTFRYTVTDGTATSQATVTVTVNGGNTPPVAVDDLFTTSEKEPLSISAPGLLLNDFDVDSQTVSAVPETGLSQLGATFRIFADGSFTYDPTTSLTLRALNDGQTADDQFSYRITDEQGAQATGRVTVTVTGITDPPYQNPLFNADVTGDGALSPLDALTLINYINANGVGPLPSGRPTPPFLDPDGDNAITPLDVLLVINALNDQAANPTSGGEAEAADDVQTTAPTALAPAVSLEWFASQTIVIGSVAVPTTVADGSPAFGTADTMHWNSIDSFDSVYEPSAHDPYRASDTADWDWDDSLDDIAEALGVSSRYESAVDEVFSELFR
jgi:large repetitive protein